MPQNLGIDWINQSNGSGNGSPVVNALDKAARESETAKKRREDLLASLTAGLEEQTMLANQDPYEVVNQKMKGKSVGREFLANLLIGLADRDGTSKGVRAQLVDREINKKVMAKAQQDSILLRLQQLMGQESREGTTAMQVGGRLETAGIQAAVRKYGIDVNAATQLRNSEQRDQQFEETLEFKRDQLTETQSINEWRKDYAEKELKLTERRVASMEKRNDLLGRPDGSYQAESPEGQALQEIAKIGNAGETKTKGQADQLMKEMSYIAEMIDTAETPEVRAKWESAGRSKVLSLAASGLSADQQKGFQFRLKTLDVINTAGGMLNKLAAEPGGKEKLGFLNGKIENWLRRYNGSASDDELTKLFFVLSKHFFEFRKEMSGVVFGEKEGAAYESISPTTDKEFNVNLVLLSEMEKENIRELMNRLSTLGPQALQMFVKNDRFIYKGREYRIPE